MKDEFIPYVISLSPIITYDPKELKDASKICKLSFTYNA